MFLLRANYLPTMYDNSQVELISSNVFVAEEVPIPFQFRYPIPGLPCCRSQRSENIYDELEGQQRFLSLINNNAHQHATCTAPSSGYVKERRSVTWALGR